MFNERKTYKNKDNNIWQSFSMLFRQIVGFQAEKWYNLKHTATFRISVKTAIQCLQYIIKSLVHTEEQTWSRSIPVCKPTELICLQTSLLTLASRGVSEG